MDGRHYDGLKAVSPGVFTVPQRQRLEAFTAAVGLKPAESVDHQVAVAQWIVAGAQ